jgi:hypothetical protein
MMTSSLLSRVENEVSQFKKDHHGEKPLFILVSPYEADQLVSEVKQAGGYPSDALVTEFEGSKIVKYDALKKGDIRLTDELPETSS